MHPEQTSRQTRGSQRTDGRPLKLSWGVLTHLGVVLASLEARLRASCAVVGSSKGVLKYEGWDGGGVSFLGEWRLKRGLNFTQGKICCCFFIFLTMPWMSRRCFALCWPEEIVINRLWYARFGHLWFGICVLFFGQAESFLLDKSFTEWVLVKHGELISNIEPLTFRAGSYPDAPGAQKLYF